MSEASTPIAEGAVSVPAPAVEAAQRELPAPWWSRALDRLNPIIIKEVRQGLRTKTFWAFFGLMLLACLVIALVAFGIAAQDGTADPGGPYYFFAFFFALAVVSFFIIPYSAYRSLAREREDETWVLLTLTGIGARRILLGKLGSSLVQAALYGSAAAPFVLFSYYLNGVDLPTILLTLGMAFAYMLFLSSISVSAATLGESRVMRAIVHLALLASLLGLTSWGLGLAGTVAFEPRSLAMGSGFKEGILVALWVMASYGYLLFEAAAARLALPTEDYAKGPRLAALVQLLVTVGIVVWLWASDGRELKDVIVFGVVASIHLGLVGMFLSSEADGQARLHRANTRWYSILRPGAVRAFRFTLLLLLGTVVAVAVMAAKSTHPLPWLHDASLLVAAPAYALFYLAFPLLIARGAAPRLLSSPMATRICAIAILFLGCGLPPLIALLIGREADDPLINFLNPLVGMAVLAKDSHTPLANLPGQSVLWAVALSCALGADRALAFRDKVRR